MIYKNCCGVLGVFHNFYKPIINSIFMTNIEDKVKAIVITSGNPQWNKERMETAIEVNEKGV